MVEYFVETLQCGMSGDKMKLLMQFVGYPIAGKLTFGD